jgi:2-C-methyl-D-erythritol 4-phosphate cytidylyltransferase
MPHTGTPIHRNTYSILLAAGKGTRFGAKKQRLYYHNQYIINGPIRTLSKHPMITECRIVIDEEDRDFMQQRLTELNLLASIPLVQGGSERFLSVKNALENLRTSVRDEDIVLIHDAARPFVTKEEVTCLVEMLNQTRAGKPIQAAALAFPVSDTIKEVQQDVIQKHYDRTHLWGMQTPQGFHFGILWNAYQALPSDALPTDDTMVVGNQTPVYIAQGSRTNIKLTYPEDLTNAPWDVFNWE